MISNTTFVCFFIVRFHKRDLACVPKIYHTISDFHGNQQKVFKLIGWNVDIAPRYAMVSFDSAEIISLEAIFPRIAFYSCDILRTNLA